MLETTELEKFEMVMDYIIGLARKLEVTPEELTRYANNAKENTIYATKLVTENVKFAFDEREGEKVDSIT